MVFCDKTGTNCKIFKRANSASPYGQMVSAYLGTLTLVNYIAMSPDGRYVCLTRSASPMAVLLKKNADDTYTDLNIAQTLNTDFNLCDISNTRAIFGGTTGVRILKQQTDGSFLDSQIITTGVATTSLKIGYFGNWLIFGKSDMEVLIYF